MAEQTLVLIKPDGVMEHHIGDIIKRIEEKGLRIVAMKMVKADDALLRQHYPDLVDKPFFPEIVDYMESGPIVAMVVESPQVIDWMHRLAGKTNPNEADFGTIRGDYGHEWDDGIMRNVVHTSDSVASAQREIKLWFPEF
ncbi:nucleoside-diphosphate kinase [Ligilactobacillus equi]|uniref:Nucleoside diphosphate kinase n=2 Tax=Ligilactobacillus equi TaxID=137357 RepID=V7HY19_9LACO|nr:nucleoside-diphosphate kinase [Ligilactobacillus equi]ETA75139.1 nucleoside-diphosphate kinase [Ligilactobacillus equi DPC 6820]KRL81028.1 nucleoside-diphosphate kinase [Ligilactobacillus equi DSM 15833 = JCM 10991]MCQ2557338.1 nucleoside-diphosphate kinase [Ligilactobacillus sp.]